MDDNLGKQIKDIQLWIAEHDGRINAWWEQQHRHNASVDRWRRESFERMGKVEKRMGWVSGFAAAVGASVGALLSALL